MAATTLHEAAGDLSLASLNPFSPTTPAGAAFAAYVPPSLQPFFNITSSLDDIVRALDPSLFASSTSGDLDIFGLSPRFLLGLFLFYLQNLVVVHAAMMLVYFGISGILWLFFYSGFRINTFFLGLTQGYVQKIQPKKGYSRETQLDEIKWSISTITVGAILVTMLVVGYRLGVAPLYHNVLDYGLPYYVFSLSLMFGFNDMWMYWTHRWLHGRWGFSHVHKIHHRFFAPTPFSTMAFHPIEAFTQYSPILGALFVPLHLPSLYAFSLFLLSVSTIEHLGYRVPFYERLSFLSTPMHHDLHHSVYRCNYAVYFTLWDWMMGTLVTEEDAVGDKALVRRLKREQLGDKPTANTTNNSHKTTTTPQQQKKDN